MHATLSRSRVTTDDGRIELDTRSFLHHDLVHLAVEGELGLDGGFWGNVAAGSSLSGDALEGDQVRLAESLAGPMQTLMRLEAGPGEIRAVLDRVAPELASDDVAAQVHERLRRLAGHWKATPHWGRGRRVVDGRGGRLQPAGVAGVPPRA